ncbi:MAG: 4-hydroxythreonine-4-phosphate dehydrogenase PdxA [Pseudomonadales bacterium]|nr:4-hydroxythreonine-4-phosphate dehydrogenase PdxA [Pseudomonadales bacterium]
MIAITPGEPAGIGPDVTLAAVQRLDEALIVVANAAMMAARATALGLSLPVETITDPKAARAGVVNVFDVPLKSTVAAGASNPSNAPYVIETLDTAVRLCESGKCDGLVTGPVNKAIINDGGVPFTGHTEWLAARTGTPHVVMMLATEGLRVALATTHLALRDVPAAINRDLIEDTLRIVDKDLRDKFGIAAPCIAVLGLNPHAGEGGHLGREEIDSITPAIEATRAAGIDAFGPLPADTAFNPGVLSRADVVLAMYHDQGLPVLKFKGFGDAVNITLGLPIVRTSVDHGTAFDLAGSGKADPSSMLTAIETAHVMARHFR